MAMFSAFMKLCIPKWYLVLNYHAGYKNILIFAFGYFVYFFLSAIYQEINGEIIQFSWSMRAWLSLRNMWILHTNVRWENAVGVLEY